MILKCFFWLTWIYKDNTNDNSVRILSFILLSYKNFYPTVCVIFMSNALSICILNHLINNSIENLPLSYTMDSKSPNPAQQINSHIWRLYAMPEEENKLPLIIKKHKLWAKEQSNQIVLNDKRIMISTRKNISKFVLCPTSINALVLNKSMYNMFCFIFSSDR